QGQALQIELRLWLLSADVIHAALAPGPLRPLLREIVADNLRAAILSRQPGKLLGSLHRIKRRSHTTNDIDDEAAILLMSDGDGVVIVAPTRRINKALIESARPRRHLQRTRIVDRGLDRRIVEVGRDVGAELGTPLGTSTLRIAGAGALNDGDIDRRVETLGITGDDKHVGIVDAVEVAVLLVKQASTPIGRADPNQHAAGGGERRQQGAIDLDVGYRAGLVS